MTAGDTRGRAVAQWSFYGCEPLERRMLMAVGDLDLAFGSGGKALTSFPGYAAVFPGRAASAAMPDGKLVVAATVGNGTSYDFAVARYNADGTPDATFGQGDGKVVVSPGDRFYGDDTDQEVVGAVAVRDDGRILVGGYLKVDVKYRWVVLQLNADGTVDSTFGNNGVAVDTQAGGDSYCNNLALDDQGRVLFSGRHTPFMSVTRLTPNGALDATFNGTGDVSIAFPNTDFSNGNTLAIQRNGKIIVGGTVGVNGGVGGTNGMVLAALARVNPDGTLDQSFGQGGLVTTDVAKQLQFNGRFSYVLSLTIDPDGRIWTMGDVTDVGIGVVGRYLPDGSVDLGFGPRRKGFTELLGGAFSEVNQITLQSDGKALVVGDSNPYLTRKTFVERVDDDGLPDPSFSGDGVAPIDSTDYSPSASVALAPDGGIVAIGYDVIGQNATRAILVRLEGDSPSIRTTGVWVSSSAWSAGFRQRLAAEGEGSADFGYPLGDNPNGAPLPWTNLDTLAVRSTSPADAATVLAIVAESLNIVSDGQSLAVQSVTTSPSDPTVTLIRLAAPLQAGRTRVRIRSLQIGEKDVFDIAVPVLPGDVDRSGGAVNASDLVKVRNAIGRNAANPGIGSAAYRTLVDLNGDGVVNASDLVLERNRVGSLISNSLVVNGSFEQPAFSDPFLIVRPGDATLMGWKVDGAGVGFIGSFWQASEGNQSVELNLYASGGISQYVPTQPGRQYRISFDLAGQPGLDPAVKRMQTFWEGSLVGTSLFDTTGKTYSDMGWSHREIIVTASGNSTQLRFFGSVPSNVDGGPVIDNVSVTPLASTAVRAATPPIVPPLFGAIEIKTASKRHDWIHELV